MDCGKSLEQRKESAVLYKPASWAMQKADNEHNRSIETNIMGIDDICPLK